MHRFGAGRRAADHGAAGNRRAQRRSLGEGEAEFVDPPSYRAHYENTVAGYVASLKDAADKGQVRSDVEEVHAWAIVGMNVFLGLRYGVMGEDREANEVAQIAADFLTNGLKR